MADLVQATPLGNGHLVKKKQSSIIDKQGKRKKERLCTK
jgi:hypothetical protein